MGIMCYVCREKPRSNSLLDKVWITRIGVSMCVIIIECIDCIELPWYTEDAWCFASLIIISFGLS